VGDRLAERGLGLLAPEPTLRLLETLLQSAPVQTVVVPVDWAVFSQTATAQRPLVRDLLVRAVKATVAERPAEVAEASLTARLAATPRHRQRALVLSWLQEQAGRVLNLAPTAVDARVPLSELGLDSLMAVELRNLVRAGLAGDQTLPTTLAFDYPTLERMTDFLLRDVLALEADVPTAEPEASGSALDSLEELSDDEVDRLFDLRLGSGQVPQS
jgi:hypothetical protein